MEFATSIYNLTDKENELICEVWRLLESNPKKTLNFSLISSALREKGICFDENQLFVALQVLLVNYKKIVRCEYWQKETDYVLLDKHYWNHRYQHSYYSFQDDDVSNKIFLLISDTHIGNEEIFNSKLLYNMYDYGLVRGAKKCFHLGDLFDGLNQMTGKQVRDLELEFNRQLELFIHEYPKPDPEELKTYCLMGNHDEIMNRFLRLNGSVFASDLRNLSIYNPSFYMFPRTHWCTNLNGRDFHFNHRLYMNFMVENLKVSNLKDMVKKKKEFGELVVDNDYDVLISGHLHRGMVYAAANLSLKQSGLYVGVPSTSNINTGGVVGCLVYLYPHSDSMEISFLKCDNNLKIYEEDIICWNFNKNNKSYCKTL